MSAFDPDQFVNREKEIAYIKEKVLRVAKGEPFSPEERVIHFVGSSGIGKSYLLEKLYYDFAYTPLLYTPILIQLESIESKRSDFINNFFTVFYEEIIKGLKLDRNFIHFSKSLSRYSFDLIRIIRLNLKDRVLVFMLDEIDLPEKENLRSIEDNLLENLHDISKVVLITAGRRQAGLNHFSLRPNSNNTIRLSPFDEQTTGKQLEKMKPGSGELAGKIYGLGGGVPGNTWALAGQISDSPPTIPDELQAVQSLLGKVKKEIEERFYPIIEAICFLPSFLPDDVIPLLEQHPAINGIWDRKRIMEAFTDINLIRYGPGGLVHWDKEVKGWAIDEPVRALFERELRMRDPKLWKALQSTAYQMYKQWGEEFNSQWYKDKAAYHQQCLKDAGMELETLENEG